MTAAETSSVAWGAMQLSYTIQRSARRKKTVAVTVDPAGTVLLVAPEHLTTEELDRIVSRKAEWIEHRLRRLQSRGPHRAPREFVSGESILYLGRHYRLKVNPSETCGAKLRGGWLHVGAAAGARQATEVREAVTAWFRRHAALRRPERVATWWATGVTSLGPAKTLGKLRSERHHPPQLAHHPSSDAPGRLRRCSRTGASTAPWPRSGLLAGRRTGHARL